MVEAIDPLGLRLAQLLKDEDVVQAAATPLSKAVSDISISKSPFEDILSKAVDALSGISKSEVYANQLIDKYVRGEVDLQDVMVATSKASVMVQMAVTTINSAVNTFKEVTQMQV